MEIRKFKHVDENGKIDNKRSTVYAVIGVTSVKEARDAVYKYKKMDYFTFEKDYKCYPLCCINTKNNKLYATSATLRHEIPCYVVVNKNISIY